MRLVLHGMHSIQCPVQHAVATWLDVVGAVLKEVVVGGGHQLGLHRMIISQCGLSSY